MRLHDIQVAGGPVTTSGVETKTIVEVNLASIPAWSSLSNHGFHVEGVLIGKNGSNEVASTRVARSAKIVSGVLSILGTLQTPIGLGAGDGSLVTSSAIIDTSGLFMRLRVTGIVVTEIEWTGFLEIWSGQF